MRCASKQRAAATIFYHLLRSWLVNIMNSGGAMPNEDEVRKRKGERGKGSPPLPLDFTSFFASVRRPICPHRIASPERARDKKALSIPPPLPPSLPRSASVRPLGDLIAASPLRVLFFAHTWSAPPPGYATGEEVEEGAQSMKTLFR